MTDWPIKRERNWDGETQEARTAKKQTGRTNPTLPSYQNVLQLRSDESNLPLAVVIPQSWQSRRLDPLFLVPIPHPSFPLTKSHIWYIQSYPEPQPREYSICKAIVPRLRSERRMGEKGGWEGGVWKAGGRENYMYWGKRDYSRDKMRKSGIRASEKQLNYVKGKEVKERNGRKINRWLENGYQSVKRKVMFANLIKRGEDERRKRENRQKMNNEKE